MADSPTLLQRLRAAIRRLTLTQWLLILIAILLIQNIRQQTEISERVSDLESTVQSDGSNTRSDVEDVKTDLDDVKSDVEDIKSEMP